MIGHEATDHFVAHFTYIYSTCTHLFPFLLPPVSLALSLLLVLLSPSCFSYLGRRPGLSL